MTYKNLKTNLEKEILMVLILGLRHNKISQLRARNVSKGFLDSLKLSKSSEQVLANISKLCQTVPELIDPFIKVARKFDEEEVGEKIYQVKLSLQLGQVPQIGGLN